MTTIKILENFVGWKDMVLFKKDNLYNVTIENGKIVGRGEEKLMFTIAENELKYEIVDDSEQREFKKLLAESIENLENAIDKIESQNLGKDERYLKLRKIISVLEEM